MERLRRGFGALALAAGALLAAALLGASGRSGAQEPVPEPFLIPGPGMELTMQRCVICHEAMHITRSRLTRAEWHDSVQQMIKRGAVVAPDEIEPIVEYLYTYYGRNPDGTPRARPEGAQAPKATRESDAPRAVAERYATTADGAAHVAQRVRVGGAGAWGAVPMPPFPSIGEEKKALLGRVYAQR
jgi:hypothetical protein